MVHKTSLKYWFKKVVMMKNVEIKKEITAIIQELPEDSLPSVLDYLKQVQSVAAQDVRCSQNLKKILTEDRQLLQRLAQ